MKKNLLLVLLLCAGHLLLRGQLLVQGTKCATCYPFAGAAQAAAIYTDEQDDWLVQKSASLLQQDIDMVTGIKLPLQHSFAQQTGSAIIIGTLQSSALIRQLVSQKMIDVQSIEGKWDGYVVQTVKNPALGIAEAIVIAGANKRGAAYGVFELSKQLGVSPWYWWADVPVKKKAIIYIKQGIRISDEPKVKYRGIFINDEAPAFSEWSKEKFGGANHLVYEKMFELLLRLKGNYLWPAMWGRAFNDDDTLNPVLADHWGIVMSTSHHEPMLRAQAEWKRYGKGVWDYTKNDSVLRAFWRKGIENMGTHESLVTIGMRGDGDMPMTTNTATALLEKIVADQRQIIADVTKKPAAETPQVWALYKEVQDYYDQGMRVPDDVTLLIADDNWGNIRKLPQLNEKPRSGGYGIYYHFDYVGDPRNYKWINTNNIARVWEQMHLAWEYNVRQVWVVNVGDLKPMELPISFFLDYAWNPLQWNGQNLAAYYTKWAEEQFTAQYAKEIGDIVRLYSQYSARIKPELLDANTYSVTNYNESQIIVDQFTSLQKRAEKINLALPAAYKDAFYQLVLHPIKANTNLHQLYRAVALNRLYAAQGNTLANVYADSAKKLYAADSMISIEYNKLAGGKWNHMMDQVHIGYTRWSDPPVNSMPAVKYLTAGTTPVPVEKNNAVSRKAAYPATAAYCFYEQDGYVSIEAAHCSRNIKTAEAGFGVIPGIGRTDGGITAFPVTAAKQHVNNNAPYAAYDVYVYDTGTISLSAYFSPTLNFHNEQTGLQYAISIDDEQPQIIGINAGNDANVWRKWVGDNIIITKTTHRILKPGKHVVTYRMIDAGPVLQKLVLDFGGVKQSHLGPPETANRK